MKILLDHPKVDVNWMRSTAEMSSAHHLAAVRTGDTEEALEALHYAAIHWNRRITKFSEVNGCFFLFFSTKSFFFFFVLVYNCKYFARKIMFTRQWCKNLDIFANNLKGVTVRAEILYTCRWNLFLKKLPKLFFSHLCPSLWKCNLKYTNIFC